MDILDIDEALKDDSFICLEDKTHDDVSNILQQWKSNNCPLPTQYQQEQAYKLNSRTFTRPRRKLAQNLESPFAHTSGSNGAQSTLPTHSEQLSHKFTIATPQPPIFNLEIGGLVTTMHKSFLQDTSPPSSICSSMEMSMERMNNSLITSADFTNINFLQSTQSLDFNEPMLNGGELFNLANKATSDGYTLSDMIRDRKALESLTMSGDGTLIKDSHIGQIDDISLALSKTASGYSTLDNSTESMQDEQQQGNGLNAAANATTVGVGGGSLPDGKNNIMHRTMLLSDDVISDTTFDLVESSLCESIENGNGNNPATAPTSAKLINETFKRPWPMDETVCLPTKANATFEFKQLTPDARLASETRCETPENLAETVAARKFYESTPHAAGMGKDAQHLTPTTSKLTIDESNLSPIVGSPEKLNATRVLHETFGQESDVKKVNSKTFSGTLPRLESIEQMLDDIENPNETYEKVSARTQELQQSAADIQMQNVLELAHAEEELLASNNDQEFEHMLEEFSKVEVNAEHVKMRKSLETIKRRFHRDTIALGRAPALQHGADSNIHAAHIHEKIVETNGADCQNESRRNGSYSKLDINASLELKRSLLNDCSAPSGLSSPSPSSASVSASSAVSSITVSGGGNVNATSERLLSRRSRLYDNINLSTISAGSSNHHSPSRSLGASFTVHKREDNEYENCAVAADAATKAGAPKQTEEKEENLGKTDEAHENVHGSGALNNYNAIGTYRLSERRERDRDRFKTIKIVKGSSANDVLAAVNVPCIDDEIACVESVSDDNAAVFNNNKSEIEAEKDVVSATGNQNTFKKSTTASKINPNFLTYKKPKDKPTLGGNLPEIGCDALVSNEEFEKTPETPSRLRSRSRPRYISGLQKMTVVKAISAGDLDRATAPGLRPPNASVSHAGLNNCQDACAEKTATNTKYQRNTQPLKTSTDDVKSPMGTKSKSFHNLSSNFGFNGSASGLSAGRNSSFGLKKPTTFESNGFSTNSARERTGNGTPNATLQLQADEAVFKVPKLMSGLRAPGVKRASLVRPSSGYYSLNSLAAKGMPPLPQAPQTQPANDADSDSGGRHSPTESMSSASSRSSLHSGGGGGSNIGKPVASATASKPVSFANTNTLNLTKITTGSTGIPKPSGLRPPTTNIKRSGLPKPATAMARR
ncbi:uncharacterized protein LOC118738914 isoform X1 [Rhagoletis pomonella]|uniref:uncharacterized protein LOC118738914 isoform X1 n=1 Tax=Rhagoletis pomonella TaxID=28610 RepID=UPI00177AFF42|nr:uncharacterized protein LOC118738914 isoform X1 [Rhagoletis pomonella]XP_036325855.1 uncharacterized protein LOC118738914 isoform X1 [Rhagoletis pomonella]